MRRVVLAAVVACASAGAVRGQEQSPAPDPAFQRLAYFVGSWKGEGEQKATSLGSPAAKFAGSMSCSAYAGGFHVVCNMDGTMGARPLHEMAIFGYDAEAKAYTWYDIDNTGMNGLARGSLEKGTWTYLFEMKAGGKVIKMKIGLVEQSPDTFLNVADVSVDGQPWEPMIRATFKRSK